MKKLSQLFSVFILLFLLFFHLYGDNENINRPKIGLVLSGGGARGIAHVGVLKMIDSLQIPIDYIAGSSMGGIVGALYASGYSGEEIEKIVNEVDWTEMFTDRPHRAELPYLQKKDDGKYAIELGLKGFTPTIPGGLIEGQKIYLLFSDLTASTKIVNNFSKLPIPFKCVGVDLVTGKEAILEKGSLPKAMRATMAIPTIFSPVEWGDSLIIDGGILNNFPANVVKKMGAEVIIGVNVGTPLKKKKDLNDLIALFEQTMVLVDFDKLQENKKLCELVITPELTGYTAADFDKKSVQKILSVGNKAGIDNKSKLIQLKEKYLGNNTDEQGAEKQSPKKYLLNEKHNFRIYSLEIKGNESLTFNFIYGHLGIKPGTSFDRRLLRQRINQLYALGYFDRITYEIEKIDEENIRLLLKVKEKPQRKLRIGFRYDNFYKLVGLVGFQGTNIPFGGFRVESEIHFAGLFRIDYKLSYPSRQLDLPIIPYLRFNTEDIPVDIYHPQNGKVIMSYDDKSITAGAGLGFRFGNVGLLEAEYNYEYVNVKPEYYSIGAQIFPKYRHDLQKVELKFTMDMLDDVILPREGLKIRAKYEVSSKSFKSDAHYQQLQVRADLYKEMIRKHGLHLCGFYTTIFEDLPIYKIITVGGPHDFVGVHYGQLEGTKFGYGRLDYRYEYKKDIFLKFIANAAFYEINQSQNINVEKVLIGYGIGVKFLSIIGPFELIFSRGSQSIINNDSFTNQMYFTAGFYF